MPQDTEYRGKDALLKMEEKGFEVYAEKVSKKYRAAIDKGKITLGKPFMTFDPKKTPAQPSHMQDFFNCIRSRKQPKDNEDEAFIEAVTCIMSVEACKQQRMVRWDPTKQEIV
ncbi:hypothetical protein FJY63_00460 [Candidatus Sumerlaeota bacterium]|nr:hypothetical protein [Candidatus Sumerlaeota bacterium]